MGQLQVKIPDTGAPVGLYQLVGSTVQRSVLGQKPVDDHIDSGVAKRRFGHSLWGLFFSWDLWGYPKNLRFSNFSHGEKEHKLPKDQHDQNGEREQPPSHLFETVIRSLQESQRVFNPVWCRGGNHSILSWEKGPLFWPPHCRYDHRQALLDMEKQRSTALDQLRMAAGPSSFGGVGFLLGPSSFGGGGGNTPAGGGGFFAGLGGGGGFFDGHSSFGGGAGPGSFGVGGGVSDNNGIVPFDGTVPDAGGSKAPYGFNHGIGRGFY
ncbi:hypothetical protein ACSBR1_019553 [Camellia fascicularis]